MLHLYRVTRPLLLAALLVLTSVGTARAQFAPPDTPAGYTVLGLDGVTLGARTRIVGHVGVNRGPATLRPNGRVFGMLAADIVTLRGNARADAIFCVLVQGGQDECLRMPDPLVQPASISIVQVAPGTEDVKIPRKARRFPLEAGRYGAVSVASGSLLELVSGSYSFRELNLARRARVVCQSACRIAVRGRVIMGGGARLELFGGLPGDGVLSIQADGIDLGLSAAGHATIAAVVYAPTADIRVGPSARIVGSLIGQSVSLGAGSRIDTAAPAGLLTRAAAAATP